jgi:hypothetical protein
VHPAKAGVDLGVGVYGLSGGPPGWIVGTIYFTGDAVIPGGWNVAIEASYQNTKHNQEILGSMWSPNGLGGLD